ncbi:hypothetical protein NQ318_015090 [Aromia moschata]|uniref:Uncharacterized protein n=1 Tax=Aromia moschata TaxID=1265417 RepID=A0AAV8YXS4_9CUCU|nr:hypothetical protein NQ318_015090 [Aromia moschata]
MKTDREDEDSDVVFVCDEPATSKKEPEPAMKPRNRLPMRGASERLQFGAKRGPKPKKKKKMRKTRQAKNHWPEERKLDLVRRMRKQYDICLKQNQFVTGKSPWKIILEKVV